MDLLDRIFRKNNPKVTYLSDFKRKKRKEALANLPYMDEREWKRKYKSHFKNGEYRF